MLLIDVGNSRLKWAQHKSMPVSLSITACAYEKNDISLVLEASFTSMEPQAVWVSCVADEDVISQITCWFIDSWGVKPIYARTQASFMGLENAYFEFDTLGVDRWLAMLAAWQLYEGAICVIDSGTAITLDVVNEKGEHQGGLILPGLNLLQQSLQMKTSSIGDASAKPCLLANNTAEAVGNGCRQMMCKSVPSIVNEFEQSLGVNLLCILTGGDAHLLMTEFKRYEYREDLVLFGLYLVASQQT